MNSADRLLAILRLFTFEQNEWSVPAAAREIGVSVPTAYRYFRSLCKAGLLDPFAEGLYVLGPAIIEYDRQIRVIDPLIKIGQPVLERLILQTKTTGVALLCRFYRNRVMCVHQETSLAKNVSSYERGRPMPLFRGAPGKIIFANLPARMARSYFSKYSREIAAAGFGSDWETVKSNLRRMRRMGICVARGEVDKGVVGIAGAVFGSNNSVLGAVVMAFPEDLETPQFLAKVSALVPAAGTEISAGLAALSAAEVNAHLIESHNTDRKVRVPPPVDAAV